MTLLRIYPKETTRDVQKDPPPEKVRNQLIPNN